MVLHSKYPDLDLSFSLQVDGFNYTVFATTEAVRHLAYGKTGHLVSACPTGKDKVSSQMLITDKTDGNASVSNDHDLYVTAESLTLDLAGLAPLQAVSMKDQPKASSVHAAMSMSSFNASQSITVNPMDPGTEVSGSQAIDESAE